MSDEGPGPAAGDELGLEKHQVRLLPHNPRWVTDGERECATVRALLGAVALEVLHIGSTAVPGMDAKPILDIAVTVGDRVRIDEVVARLCAGGTYSYDGDRREDGGLLFVRGEGSFRTVHVHVVGVSSQAWKDYRRFHGLLINDAAARALPVGQARTGPALPAGPRALHPGQRRRRRGALGIRGSAPDNARRLSRIYGWGLGSHPREEIMGIFQRAHDIVQAKTNKALDAAEKPDEMLDLSYEKMLEQITQVRRALVDIAASKKRLELQDEQFQHTLDHLQEQAKQALAANREDLAKEALSRKAAAQQQIDQIQPQVQQLDEEEQKLTQTLDVLQKRVNDFRTQKETLKAQYTAAKAISSVDESTAGISKSFSDSGATLQRAQDKIATMQARSGALDELLESGVLEDVGGGTDDIQKELDQVGKDAQVDNELAALKAQLGTGTPEPEALAAAPEAAPEESTPTS